MRYCTFIFPMSCSIASVTSYLSENEAKNLQMATSILLKFLTLKWNISRTIGRIEVGDGSFFLAFFTLFHLSFTFFRPEVPFKCGERIKLVKFLSKQRGTEQCLGFTLGSFVKTISNVLLVSRSLPIFPERIS